MSIQVPLFLKSLSHIKQPLPPSDPPTSQDIVHAIVFLEKVKEFFSPLSFKRKLCLDYHMATVDDLTKVQPQLGQVEIRLDQMNKTLFQVMDNFRIHGLEQWLDSGSQNHPFNGLQLYDQILISWDREDELEDLKHVEINFALHMEIVLSFNFEKECFQSSSSLAKHTLLSTAAMEGAKEENVGVIF
ncbi:hypothetical protein BDR06DRAFT_1060397 [Suillus hirtellus]|nr:hypothetical protein BDR06DRAFT_1060397 [Suillus hirtellus]